MAHADPKPEFFVVNGPGPYQLLKDYMSMFDERQKPIVDLVIRSNKKEGNTSYPVRFEIALIGPAPSPERIRLLGRFRSRTDSFGHEQPLISGLGEWQWDIVYDASREGLVFRLEKPLPEEWTL